MKTIMYGNVWQADPTETDQGVEGNGRSANAIITDQSSYPFTMVFAHTEQDAATVYTFSTNEELPANCHTIIEDGVQISVDTGKTLTITGPVDFPDSSCFAGAGTVTLLPTVASATSIAVNKSSTYISGTATIQTITGDVIYAGNVFKLHFAGALTLTDNTGNLNLINSTNQFIAAGNTVMFFVDSSLDCNQFGGPVREIQDADGDTKIQVEESADEDIIRMDVGSTEQFNLSANGLVMVKQPAFNVGMSADQDDIATGSDITIQFDTERFDQGADFNTTTYTFTAPVTGKYPLFLALGLEELDTGSSQYSVGIETSNYSYTAVMDPGKFSADLLYYPFPLAVLADMDINDTVYAVVRQATGTAQTDIDASETTFSGYLAC